VRTTVRIRMPSWGPLSSSLATSTRSNESTIASAAMASVTGGRQYSDASRAPVPNSGASAVVVPVSSSRA
jgi:hypothetical protein